MGQGFELRCKSCDYSKDFFLGIGMMDSSLKVVNNGDNIKNKKIRQELTDLINNHVITESHYGHEIFRCETCDELYRKFYVEVVYDEGKVYRSEYRCVRCGVELVRVGEEVEFGEVSCPGCKGKGLYVCGGMDWD